MRTLREVWSEKVIKGSFKGDIRAYAMTQFKAGTKLVCLGKRVGSLLELMAIADNQLFIADEEIPSSTDAISNILLEFEGKEILTTLLMEKLREFSEPGTDLLAKLYEDGRLDYRMDKTYIKPVHEVTPETMTPVSVVSNLNKVSRVAKLTKVAGENLFLQNALKCPNCGSNMKVVKLAGSVEGWFCGGCRHCDFSDKVKSTSRANIQTVDKILEFRNTDNGNCEISN